jgi:hypothetical protein
MDDSLSVVLQVEIDSAHDNTNPGRSHPLRERRFEMFHAIEDDGLATDRETQDGAIRSRQLWLP